MNATVARVIVALAIAGALAVILILLTHDVQGEAPVCLTEEERERARNIMIDGFDSALKKHTEHIFDIWMKDTGDQPKRAIIGMRTGVSAHARSRKAASAWEPPACPAPPLPQPKPAIQ